MFLVVSRTYTLVLKRAFFCVLDRVCKLNCQRYFNLLCKLGSVCVDINEIRIFYEKPHLWFSHNPNETFVTLWGLYIKLLKSINVQWTFNWQKCRLLNTVYSNEIFQWNFKYQRTPNKYILWKHYNFQS